MRALNLLISVFLASIVPLRAAGQHSVEGTASLVLPGMSWSPAAGQVVLPGENAKLRACLKAFSERRPSYAFPFDPTAAVNQIKGLMPAAWPNGALVSRVGSNIVLTPWEPSGLQRQGNAAVIPLAGPSRILLMSVGELADQLRQVDQSSDTREVDVGRWLDKLFDNHAVSVPEPVVGTALVSVAPNPGAVLAPAGLLPTQADVVLWAKPLVDSTDANFSRERVNQLSGALRTHPELASRELEQTLRAWLQQSIAALSSGHFSADGGQASVRMKRSFRMYWELLEASPALIPDQAPDLIKTGFAIPFRAPILDENYMRSCRLTDKNTVIAWALRQISALHDLVQIHRPGVFISEYYPPWLYQLKEREKELTNTVKELSQSGLGTFFLGLLFSWALIGIPFVFGGIKALWISLHTDDVLLPIKELERHFYNQYLEKVVASGVSIEDHAEDFEAIAGAGSDPVASEGTKLLPPIPLQLK